MVEVHRVGEFQQRNVIVQVLRTVRVQRVVNHVDDTAKNCKKENENKRFKNHQAFAPNVLFPRNLQLFPSPEGNRSFLVLTIEVIAQLNL